MAMFTANFIRLRRQYLLSIFVVLWVSSVSFALSPILGYKMVALILLATVSIIAMLFDILPVLLAAVLSALIWDFFFIPPHFTLHINDAEDTLLLMMYFVIAMVNATLTYKIRQREKVIREKEKKAETIKLYNTLLNSLSHELRTPISTIIAASDNLLNDKERVAGDLNSELLTEISVASLRLNRQVENLLNMSRLESGVISAKKDWCDVNDLIYSAIEKISKPTDQHHIEVEIPDSLPLFKLDYGLMEEVVRNLVDNALTYTPSGSTVWVKADCENEQLMITVEDNGPGFPEEEISNVFEKFFRLRNAKTGGVGLGLSIVKGFVEAHGGTIRLTNRTEGGALFTLQIPAEVSYLKNLKNE